MIEGLTKYDFLIYGLGFFSQFLFFARNIVQWFKSEQLGRIISPTIYWQISLAASIMMLTYGILRNDFAIVLGQFIVYGIYIRNLQLKDKWKSMHIISRILAIIVPIIYLIWLIYSDTYNFDSIFYNEEVPMWLLIWGSAGQLFFTFRFIYQWIYSENKRSSELPLGFWIISTIGSLMIFSYSIYRLDPVLFAAHSLGLIIYIRNIYLHFGKKSLASKFEKNRIINKISTKISDRIDE